MAANSVGLAWKEVHAALLTHNSNLLHHCKALGNYSNASLISVRRIQGAQLFVNVITWVRLRLRKWMLSAWLLISNPLDCASNGCYLSKGCNGCAFSKKLQDCTMENADSEAMGFTIHDLNTNLTTGVKIYSIHYTQLMQWHQGLQ